MGTYLQHPPGLSTQDFAPPKPLIDLLVEKSPALTVKLWSKVQLGREVWTYGPHRLWTLRSVNFPPNLWSVIHTIFWGTRFGPTEPMKLTARWMSGSRQWRPARAAQCTTRGSTMWCTRWKPCQSAGAKLCFGNSLGSCGGLQNTNLHRWHRSAYTSSSFKLGATPKSQFNIV